MPDCYSVRIPDNWNRIVVQPILGTKATAHAHFFCTRWVTSVLGMESVSWLSYASFLVLMTWDLICWSCIRFKELSSVLYCFDWAKGSITHSVKLCEQMNKHVAIREKPNENWQIRFSVFTGIPVCILICALAIKLFIAPAWGPMVNGGSRMFCFVLVALRHIFLFCHQPQWLIVAFLYNACGSV